MLRNDFYAEAIAATTSHAAVDPNGTWVATVTAFKQLDVWRAATGERVFTRSLAQLGTRFQKNRDSQAAYPNIMTIFFTADGSLLHVVGRGGLFVTFQLTPRQQSEEAVDNEIAIRTGLTSDVAGSLRVLEPEEISTRISAHNRSALGRP